MIFRHPTEIPQSNLLFFEWIGQRVTTKSANVLGDTYPITWADDGELYTGSGDSHWMVMDGKNYAANMGRGGWRESPETFRAMSGLTIEKISGEPEQFEVFRQNDMPQFTHGGGGGPKPAGIICVDGSLYFAAQNMLGFKAPLYREPSQHGADAVILRSDDHGRTWLPKEPGDMFEALAAEQYVLGHKNEDDSWITSEEDRKSFRGWSPMFPGTLFGGPSFVQFGRNNGDAVDDYVYALSPDQWNNGRCLRLGRVPKTKIQERGAWEFSVDDDRGNVIWTKNLEEAKPVLEIDNHISLPEMVYVKSIRRYLLLTWSMHVPFKTASGSELTILESENPWGPFSLVHYDWVWYNRECCPYTPRIPLKWLDQEKLEGYILFSGDWEALVPYYVPQLQKFRLKIRRDNSRQF